MTVSPTERARDGRIARYAAIAIGLAMAEAALPSPLPGIKPGLANVVILIVLARHGWAEAAWVSVLRVLVASLLTGQLFAPGFFLAGAGALTSLIVLWAAARLPSQFGPVSHGVLAACAHVTGQLALAAGWLVPLQSVAVLAPMLYTAAVLSGLATGIAAAELLRRGQHRLDLAHER